MQRISPVETSIFRPRGFPMFFVCLAPAPGTPIFVLLTLVMLRLESPSMIRTMFVAQRHRWPWDAMGCDGATPIAGWFMRETSQKWMMVWGSPILGNRHINGKYGKSPQL